MLGRSAFSGTSWAVEPCERDSAQQLSSQSGDSLGLLSRWKEIKTAAAAVMLSSAASLPLSAHLDAPLTLMSRYASLSAGDAAVTAVVM